MTARSPIVKVELTEEQKSLVPDWDEQVAVFQRRFNERAKDKRQRFLLCLHEGGHAVQYREFGWNVKFHGPYVSYDRERGKLSCALGAVSPIRTNNYDPLHWQCAMVCTSSFLLVEHFTGQSDDPFIIQHDLKSLRSQLGENADINQAVHCAEIMLEDQLNDPTLISRLEQACRDYEMDVYGNAEATQWGWTEYHPELLGKRHRVAVPYCGDYGFLVENEGNLKLVVDGKVLRPEGKLYGMKQDVRLVEPERVGTHHLVQAWNEAVRCSSGS